MDLNNTNRDTKLVALPVASEEDIMLVCSSDGNETKAGENVRAMIGRDYLANASAGHRNRVYVATYCKAAYLADFERATDPDAIASIIYLYASDPDKLALEIEAWRKTVDGASKLASALYAAIGADKPDAPKRNAKTKAIDEYESAVFRRLRAIHKREADAAAKALAEWEARNEAKVKADAEAIANAKAAEAAKADAAMQVVEMAKGSRKGPAMKAGKTPA